MKVEFSDSEYIELTSTNKGLTESLYDRAFEVKLISDVSVVGQEVWVDGYAVENFIVDLDKLRLTLKGKAVLTSETPGELLLCLKPVDSLGHFIFSVELGSQTYIGNEVCWIKGMNAFPIATEQLSKICDQMASYLRGVVDA